MFKKPVFLIPFLFAVWNTGFVFAQITAPPIIENLNKDTIKYCSDSVLVAPQISVLNIKINEASEGMKISIANYKRGEDVLTFSELPNFNYRWDSNYGFLEIKGVATAAEYQAAVRKVYYKNIANTPNLEDRSFSISLLDADYLPQTEHFYRYIKQSGIKWTEARDSAARMNYYGLQGYLTTITSQNENDFIWTKIDGVGWIGASDSLTEGTWKWVTGPEKGTVFWRGNFTGNSVNGQFSFWNRNEPNNVVKSWGDDEDYAHINSNPNTIQKSWNDLSNEGDKNNPGGYYYPQGFIVEFGGMKGDPPIKLSATAVIKVSKIAFSDEREFEICKGDKQQLNIEASDIYTYSWTPNENINSTTVSNPYVNPNETKTYTVTGKLDFCESSAEFLVQVNPVPTHKWEKENIICKGASIELDPGQHTSYLWENLATSRIISVLKEDWYTVKLTNEFGCTSKDSTRVRWSKIPVLDYGEFSPLVCGKTEQNLNLSFENGEATTNLKPLQLNVRIENENSLSPTIKVDNFGVYSFQMDVTDQNNCSFSDTIKIEFHNQPTAQFQIDEAECEGYNLKLVYTGKKVEDANFDWYSSDTLFYSGINIDSLEIPLGYGAFSRSVGLKINEQGCVDSLKLPVTVTPILDFWAENSEGCTPLNVNFDFSATEPVDNFLWDFGDGTNSTTEKPIHNYKNSGTTDLNYDVQLKIISSEGCENKGVLNNAVKVHPIPTIDFSFEENICYPDSMQIFYEGSASANDNFLWDLTNLEENEIIRNPNSTAGPLEIKRSSEPTLEIGLRITSQFGCNTDSISKKIKRKPIFETTIDETEGCPPLTINFSVNTIDIVDEVNYFWNFGNGQTGTETTETIEYFEAGKKYDIQIVANSSLTGCADTLFLSDKIFVYPVPIAKFDANPNTILISNPVVQFDNLSEGATRYFWDFGDNSFLSEEENPEHRFLEMGFNTVVLKAFNEFACGDSASQQISVIFDKLFPPNAFSPNAISEEDHVFRIHSIGIKDEGYQLLIFNRWGEIIFKSESQEIGWDGKMKNGNNAPAGVYSWVIQYADFRGEKFKQQGTVTLLF